MPSLPISSLRLDFQPAECLFDEVVETYEAAMKEGKRVRPVRVRFDGQTYWLQDGFHRVAAARRVGRKRITAEVLPGTYADMEAEWADAVRAIRENAARWVKEKGDKQE